MAPTFVQSKGGITNTASPLLLAYNSNITAGSLLVCGGRCNASITGISDSLNGAWTIVANQVITGTSGLVFFMAYFANSAAGASTVTITSTGVISVSIVEFSGIKTTLPLDQSTFTAAVQTGPALSSGSVTPTKDGELIVGIQGNSVGPASVTAGSGFSHLQNDSSNVASTESLVQGAATAVAATFTADSSTGYAVGVMTFFAATPAPVGGAYSVPDCRVAPVGPNASRLVQATKIYDVQTSSNHIIPPTDSRIAPNIPVDSRVAANIPQNSRTPGTFGPGVN